MKLSNVRLSLHDWASLQSELIWAYDHRPASSSRQMHSDHTRRNWAWFIRTGSVLISGKSGEYKADAGEWLLLPAECHKQNFSSDASLISLKFSCQWPTGENIVASPQALIIKDCEQPRMKEIASSLAQMFKESFPNQKHKEYARQSVDYRQFTQLQRVFQDWLQVWLTARLSNGDQIARQPGDTRILSALRTLNDAPLNAGFPKASLSTLGIGMAQLNRLFKHEMKMSLQQHWERRRIEFARSRLADSEQTQKSIAYSLGFSDAAHFNTWFKRHTGIPPGRYRTGYAAI
ncbi:MAG TPA: hypothetical protein DEA90_14950 [Opitutae bacterium]|nr:hypothetical protein [Puniceicoccaceae bacterium]HBR95457.1 hypothetical protein [Opitutae bacterium]